MTTRTLDAATVMPRLRTRWLGRDWRWKATTESTNDEARALAEAGAPGGTVVVAEKQSKGRGRRQRPWHSPSGGLFLSAILRPEGPAEAMATLSLAIGVAVANALEAHGGHEPALKWPNDVLLGERKAAGILVETATEGRRLRHAIAGIGVNLNVDDFPDSLRDTAISLHRVRGSAVDTVGFAVDLCARLEVEIDRLERHGAAAVVERWLQRGQLGRHVRVRSGATLVEGTSVGLDPDGALRVRLADGRIHRAVSGELL